MRRDQPTLLLADVKFRPADLSAEFIDDSGKDADGSSENWGISAGLR